MDQVIPPAAPGSVTDVISSAGAPAGTRAVEDVQHSAHGEHTGPAATPPGFVPKVFLAQFGLFGALMTPVLVTMALRVAEVDPDNKTSSLSLVLGVGAIFALIANPLVGRLSDRTTSRLGRRRPWLIGGVVGGLTGLALIAFVPSIPVILLGWIITQICYNASLATLQATVPDQVAHRDRGKVSGALGVALTLAIVVSATLAGQVADARVQFLVPAVLAIVLVGCFAVTMEDKPLATAPEPFSVKEFAGSFWTNPVEHRDFGWAWVSKFLVTFGMIAPTSYLAYYLTADFGVSDSEVAAKVSTLIVITYLCNAGAAAVSGWLSDRVGARKPFILGSSLVVVAGLVVLALAPGFTAVVLAQVLIGLGGGMFYAVDLALVTEVLPDPDTAAKDLGVMNIANALPQSLAPAVVSVVLVVAGGENYPLFFAVAAALAAVGALSVTRIRGIR